MRNLFRQSSRRQKHRLPSALSAEIQLLEQRTLPAGTVTAVVSGGNLTLTGDNRSNQVTINVTATGLTVMGTDGTLIARGARSSSTQVFTGNNNFRDVTINLANGDDSLTVNVVGTGVIAGNLMARRNLTINTGNGNDSVTVNNATLTSGAILVGGDLTVSLGAGNDSLRTSTPPVTVPPNPSALVRTPISVTGNVKITGDIGDDIVDLEALAVGKHLTIETGSGNDQVVLTDSTVTGNATVALSAGDDDLDTDGLTVAGTTSIDAGSGNDGSLAIANSTFVGLTKIDLQSGNDELFLSSEFQNVLRVTGGTDNDNVGVGSDADGIGSSILRASSTFNLGTGNDEALIDNVEFFGNTAFDFGDGNDFVSFGFFPTIGEPQIPIFRTRAVFNFGAGDDEAIISAGEFVGNTAFDLGDGNDFVTIGLDPEIGVAQTPIFRALSSFSLGGGNDAVRLVSADFQGNAALNLGAGDDELTVDGAPLTRGEDVVISVDAGEGDDTLFYEIAALIALDLEALADEDNTVFEVKEDLSAPMVP